MKKAPLIAGETLAASRRAWSRGPCASDWGLWRTFTANLEALNSYPGRFDPSEGSKERIEEEPKTFGWKMRAKIGDRKRWYDLLEEVEGDHDL